MEKVVLASGNAGKLRELKATLVNKNVEFIPQSDFFISDAVEDGLSFVENAIIKARHASKLTGLPALSDDSGLEVDAINGAPGIYSARYANSADANRAINDAANNKLLLKNLLNIPQTQRSARFHCAMALVRYEQDPLPLICQGSWEGQILFTEVGNNGFGYDSLFYVPTHQCASAELDPAVKNKISHRAQAIQQLLQRWPG